MPVLLAAGLAGSAGAQRDAVSLPADTVLFKAPQQGTSAAHGLSLPPPPRSLENRPRHDLPRIPAGRGGNPEPDTPPAREAAPAAPLSGTGAFTYFTNELARPTGASISSDSVVEPCAAHVQDTVLYVGNWYAGLSRDNGKTWTNVFPSSFFAPPPSSPSFCCDQRADYVASHDLTVWLLQYSYNTSSRTNTQRIAVANGRDELRSGNVSDWTLYDFAPRDFGFPVGTWLDFPDVGFNADWMYLSANVYDAAGMFVGAVVWRVSLYDMQLNRTATVTYLTDATMGGNSYRFATRAGDGSNMYWATLLTTTTIRIWRQNTIGLSRDYVDRPTAVWQSTVNDDCTGPDGRGWLGDATRNPIGRIRGACGTASELVFAWTSDGNGGTRPRPYTRVIRFRVSDRSLLAEHDVYSTTDCWAYAALDSNTLGHVGGVIAIGGPTRLVRTSGFLIDQYDAWNAVVAYRMGNPAANPRGEYFGDYFDVQRSWIDGRTFVGTGNYIGTGDLPQPRYTWFGRNDYEVDPVRLDVTSAPVSGVPIGIDVTDLDGNKDGTTGFQRRFTARQGFVLTAPSSFTSGGTTFLFQRWLHDGLPRGSGLQLTVDDMGLTDDVAEAQYRARRAITFETSPHITTPVGITVHQSDLNGQFGGLTPFTRQYLQTTQVRVTLPASSVGGHPFKHWRIDDVVFPAGQLSVDFTVGNRDARAIAVFFERTPGTFTPFSTGCDGSNGPDVHSGSGQPETGSSATWQVIGGPPTAPAVLVLGASNTSWLGVPLPLPLPNAAGCLLNASMDASFALTTGSGGVATLPVTIPNATSLIGGHVYTQFLCVDLAANQLGVSASNGLDTRVGGVR